MNSSLRLADLYYGSREIPGSRRGARCLLLGLLAVVLLCPVVEAQTRFVGNQANNFRLTNVRTGEPFELTDLEGSIVVLDFFFYW